MSHPVPAAPLPELDRADPRASWLTFAEILLLLTVPQMLLAFLLAETRATHDWVRWEALLIAAIGLVGLAFPKLLPGGRGRSATAVVLLGTGVLVFALCRYNFLYADYLEQYKPRNGDIFRKAMRTKHNPLYGERAVTPIAAWFWPMLAAAAFLTITQLRKLSERWAMWQWGLVLLTTAGLIVSFALSESRERLGFDPGNNGYALYYQDVQVFDGVADLLANYVPTLQADYVSLTDGNRTTHTRLGWLSDHYPPGNLLTVMIEQRLGIANLLKLLTLLAVVATTPIVHLITRELGGDERAGHVAALLYAATWPLLIFGTLNPSSLTLLPASLCVLAALRCVNQRGAFWAVMLGLSFCAYVLFSFSCTLLAAVIALAVGVLLLARRLPVRVAVVTAAISLSTFSAVWLMVYAMTDFNLYACFRAANANHYAQQGGAENLFKLGAWAIRSSGNLLAYAYAHTPMIFLAIAAAVAAVQERHIKPAAIIGVTLFMIVLCAGMGTFVLETERIWLPFTPLLAAAAGWEVSRRSTREPHAAIMMIMLTTMIAVAVELTFKNWK